MRQIVCTFMVLTSCVLHAQVSVPWTNVHAQVSVTWTNFYSGPTNAHDYARGIAVDTFGNSHVVGVSAQAYAYQSVIVTTKYNASGSILWSSTWGNPQLLNQAIDIQLDSAGNVFVCGVSKGATGQDLVLIKYTPSGLEQWVQQFGRELVNHHASAMALDSAGHTYLAGTSSGDSASSDFLTIKYDQDGNLVWAQTQAVSNTIVRGAVDIAVDNQGHVVVVGATYLPTGPAWTVLMKYNADGALMWECTYPSSPNAQRIALDHLGNIYVGTSTNRYIVTGPVTAEVTDFLVLKYSSLGELLWSRTYRGPVEFQSSYLMNIAVDFVGSVYATGGGGPGSPLTVKWDSDGTKQWVSRCNNQLSTGGTGSQIILHTNGSTYVGGYNYGHQEDFVALKYDADGNQKWDFTYDQDGERNFLAGFALGASGDLFLTGASKFFETGPDILTLKLEEFPIVGLPEILSRPQDIEAVAGRGDATFSVSVESSTPVSYQWRFNGRDILGATQPSYTVTTPDPSEAGEYSVRVSNSMGVTATPEARLTIRRLPVVTISIASASAAVVGVTAEPGQIIELQASDNLSTWETLVSSPASAEGTFTHIDSVQRPRRFYRVAP